MCRWGMSRSLWTGAIREGVQHEMNVVDNLWWKLRKGLVGKRKLSNTPARCSVVCDYCDQPDCLSIVESRASSGKRLYRLGCERCNESLRFVPRSVALGIEKHYVTGRESKRAVE